MPLIEFRPPPPGDRARAVLREARQRAVSTRDDGVADGPGYREFGVRPEDAALRRGVVIFVHLIVDVRGLVADDAEAVGETGGDPEQPPVHVAQLEVVAAPEGRRVRPDVHRHVPYTAAGHAHELAL